MTEWDFGGLEKGPKTNPPNRQSGICFVGNLCIFVIMRISKSRYQKIRFIEFGLRPRNAHNSSFSPPPGIIMMMVVNGAQIIIIILQR